GEDLKNQTARVSDQIIINVPANLNVERYIIGEKPTGEYNDQYTYIQDRNQITEELSEARQIYTSS
ncbi:MAG: hypothetical protein ACOCXH_08665, partial [Cyclobacteriaceae bacterium]